MKPISVDAILFVAQSSPAQLESLLPRIDRIQWPRETNELKPFHDQMVNCLAEPFLSLYRLAITGHILMSSSQGHNPDASHTFLSETFPGDLLPDFVKTGNAAWRLAPVLVVQKQASIRYFMVGASHCFPETGWPDWFDRRIDDTCRDSIQIALLASRTRSHNPDGIFIFPLVSPRQDGWQFWGRSLGLPIALAALSALTNQPLAPGIAATGHIRQETHPFAVGPVEEMEKKSVKAAQQGFRLLLYPGECNPVARIFSGMQTRQVADLDEAWLWARMYDPACRGDIDLLRLARHDPKTLINNIPVIRHHLLKWLCNSEYRSALAHQIVSQTDLIKKWIDQMEACIETSDIQKAETLSQFFPQEAGFEAIRQTSPFQGFRWAAVNLKIANHLGDNHQSSFWNHVATPLQNHARNHNPKEYSSHINNSCVTLHNFFIFNSKAPDDLLRALDEEKKYKRPGESSYILGSIYGTLAQNFAFCGPDYLMDVKRCIKMAQKEFGNGDIPDFQQDWLRGYGYLVFAFLDAGKPKDAKAALWHYLGVDGWEGVISSLPGLSWFFHFALARYIADCIHLSRTNAEKVLADRLISSDPKFEVAHPFQLIAWNLGRIAISLKKLDRACFFFERSLSLCLPHKETIRIMAMLPLAGLNHIGCLKPVHLESLESVRDTIRHSSSLNPDHFKPLLSVGAQESLNLLWDQPSRFFPFMYR